MSPPDIHDMELEMNAELAASLEERIASLEALVCQTVAVQPDTLYTPEEVRMFLRCGKSNVYNLLVGGDLAVTKVGSGSKGLKVKGSDLLAFLESRKTGGPKPRSNFKHLKV